ncbi:MAG: hypothetical protein JWM72_3540 [Actinomycetia bacterium]|nr:hypothetical protein [Actinomycetes bacterium]
MTDLRRRSRSADGTGADCDAYQLDRLTSEQEVFAIAEKWRLFRSLATSYLFASAFDRDDVEA